jgi:hypothetical protein
MISIRAGGRRRAEPAGICTDPVPAAARWNPAEEVETGPTVRFTVASGDAGSAISPAISAAISVAISPAISVAISGVAGFVVVIADSRRRHRDLRWPHHRDPWFSRGARVLGAVVIDVRWGRDDVDRRRWCGCRRR